jgi:hypothetical protein
MTSLRSRATNARSDDDCALGSPFTRMSKDPR